MNCRQTAECTADQGVSAQEVSATEPKKDAAMSRDLNNASLERLIAQVRLTDGAGVFSRTPVDVSSLVTPPAPSRWVRFYERAVVGLPLAACLGVVFGLASMERGSMSSTVSPSPLAVGPLAEVVRTDAPCKVDVATSCLSGPGMPVPDECACVDFDDDGDVDMLDMSSYQRMVASLN